MAYETAQLDVFQDLLLRGPSEARSALRRALLNRVVSPWRHAEERERKLLKDTGSDGDALAFEREATEDLPAATLWLWLRSDGYHVTNIVPIEFSKLNYSEYNALLRDFDELIAVPAAWEVGFEVEMSSSRQSLGDWLPLKAVQALQRFSRLANKATGSAHPLDR